MGIELPAELADIAQRTGAQWPEADEDAMLRQSGAWRDAASELGSLAGDADSSASGALDAMVGAAGDAARSHWSGFVDPDRGKLTTAVKGATQAADRLEHAAGQIAEAKVEIVRQLTHAARNEGAAQAAADGGHPSALLGLPNLLGAVSTNLASVNESLVGAVADTARGLDPSEVVNPNPHSNGGRHGLVGAVTGLGAEAVAASAEVVDGVPAEVASGRDVARSLAGTVEDTAAEAPPAVDSGPGPQWRAVPPALEDVASNAPTPPSGLPGAHASGSFAEAETPRSGIPLPPGPGPGGQPSGWLPSHGQTTLAGYADAPLPPAAAQPAPAAAPPLPGAGPAGAAFGAAVGGGGHAAGGAAGSPPQGQGGGAAAPGAPGAPAGRGGERGSARGFGGLGGIGDGQQPPNRPEPRQAPPPAQQAPHRPEPRQAPPPAQQQPQPQPALGTQRQDRQTVVALFLVHMFPIGHLPKARSEPARQLPPPPTEADFAAGLRFEPHDHPDSDVITGDAALAGAASGPPAPSEAEGLAGDHPAVAELCAGYDPLAEMNERDWDRRYLVKPDESAPEFAWPPGELYPEGGCQDGEPVTLPVGTVIDRFGGPAGRVFAKDGTAYRKRSLPPTHLDAGYHRYRVLRELPMWRAVSAGWFGQTGGGVRLRAVYPAADLVALGYLEDVTAQTSGASGENAVKAESGVQEPGTTSTGGVA